MKRIAICSLALLLALSTAACGWKRPAASSSAPEPASSAPPVSSSAAPSQAEAEGETPEEAVNNLVKAVKALDLETAKSYLGGDLALKTEKLDLTSEQNKELAQVVVKDLSCKVLSSEIDGKNATVKAEITTLDFGSVVQSFLGKSIALTMGNLGKSGDDLNAKLMDALRECIQDCDKTATKTVDIALEPSDDSWVVSNSDELQDALLGGLSSLVKEFSGLLPQ